MSKDMKRSQRQERRLSQRAGGTTNSGSGSGWMRKNDVRSEDLSIEAKTTMAKQFTLKLNDLKKAEKYALLDDRSMVFAIEMAGENYVVLTEDDYFDLKVQADGGYDDDLDPRPAHALLSIEDDYDPKDDL